MPSIFHYEHTVADAEIDAQGHASNVCYVDWMQRAALAHSAAQGWRHADYVRAGLVWVVRSHKIKYVRSALLGDAITVRTWVANMKRFSSLRKYHIVRRADDAVLATAETEWVLVKVDSRSLTPIPPELSASFEVVADERAQP